MKISTLVLATGVLAAAMVLGSGCSSTTSEVSASPQQRTAQTTGDRSIPAPAQGLAAQQDQRKTQMDAMRAADAKATR